LEERVEPRHTILVIDDASMFRELGALFLARSGRVITANNGDQGLEALRRERPDVVVADLLMPGMSGDALCRIVKADPNLCQTPVILVTSGDDAGERARAVRSGADDVIAKPISRLALIQVVNRFLRSPHFRGLTRVVVETPVRIQVDNEHAVGHARNLSRGGIFVEADPTPEPATEVALRFRLPGVTDPLAPTATVVWRRDHSEAVLGGMGLQFLEIDRASIQRIEDFIYEFDLHSSGPLRPGSSALTS
jgi:uncharacterized protein (TIGR02266 family)